jgi:hypothetical protein
MEKIPFSEANSRLTAQTISLILGRLNFQQKPQLVTVVSPISPPYINTTHLFMV